MKEKTISAKVIKKKLANLEEYLPGGGSPDTGSLLYDAVNYLVSSKNPSRIGRGKMNAQGFVTIFDLLFIDMQRGINGYNHEPLPENIRDPMGGMSLIAYRKIPLIARAICPKDFAEQVEQFCFKFYGKKYP